MEICNMKPIICSINSLLVLIFCTCTVNAEELSFQQLQSLLLSGNKNKTVDSLTRYIQNNPDSLKAYVVLAKTLYIMGDQLRGVGGQDNRSKAEGILHVALQRNPGNISLLYLISNMYIEIRLFKEEIKYLEMIFEIDPSNEDVIDQLIKYYIYERMIDKVKTMATFMEKAIQNNPNNRYNYFNLGRLEIELGNPDQAIEVLKKGVELNPTDPAFHRLLSEAYLWNEQGKECTIEYYRWLELEKDMFVLDTEYELTKLSMDSKDVQIFEKTPDQGKKEFLIKYWRINDSYPITVQNERLIEFMRRVTYAKTFYHSYNNQFGFMDIGKAIIRWGTRSFNEIPEKENVLSQEKVTKTEYKYRPHEKGIDSRLRYLPLAKYDSLTYTFFSKKYLLRPGEPNYIPPPSEPSYKVKLEIDKLEFDTRTTQFRGDSGKTRIEVAFGLPLKQLKPKSDKQSSNTYTFETDLIVHDSLVNINVRTHGTQQFKPKPKVNYSRINFTNDEKHDILPGDYKLSFQIIEKSNIKGDFITEPIRVRDFSVTDLMISDVKFSEKIDFLGIDAKTGLERLYIMPYPFSMVKQSSPLYIYFEVYNLFLEPGSGSKYAISLKAAKQDKEGNFITQPFRALGKIFFRGTPKTIETINERMGDKQTALEYLELDVSGLETGRTRLIVTVEDKLSHKKAENSVEFELKK